jgi:mRNA interferase MazF
MAIAKGNVVLVEFPFTDLSQTKLRLAVVLAVNLTIDEITLCFISSQQVDRSGWGIPRTPCSPTPRLGFIEVRSAISEFALLDSDPDFPQTGLRISSKVRVTRITTLNRQLIVRRLGSLGKQHLQQLKTSLIQAFQLAP